MSDADAYWAWSAETVYDLTFDETNGILTVRTEGFWTLPTHVKFSANLIARGIALKLRHGRFATLTDMREMPVQSLEVAKSAEFLMSKAVEIMDTPVAFVCSTHLSRVQTERVLSRDNTRVFMDWDEAVAWLDEVWVRKHVRAAA